MAPGDIQRREDHCEDHWAIVELVGKAGHVRTVPVPAWVKTAVDRWTESASIANGRLFRSIRKDGTVWGDGITQNVIWHVVKGCAARVGIKALAPHDLRRNNHHHLLHDTTTVTGAILWANLHLLF